MTPARKTSSKKLRKPTVCWQMLNSVSATTDLDMQEFPVPPDRIGAHPDLVASKTSSAIFLVLVTSLAVVALAGGVQRPSVEPIFAMTWRFRSRKLFTA